ncbi:GRB2-associated-binding protein 1-like isoform X2 [Brienomyrus brachyistius]|uniref:GRB2-associated-binding protein 1-like isoform X2 n=1 Tax=Brienomyrus brachyistius TaxID=42636 RepID=UPI0020B34853|nr:GRB2-associated-binding protein 1-like isoform X2 [Brienomyrus brachyistius]
MSGGDVVCSGWLRKSPPEKKLRRYAWKKRWFVLRSGRLTGDPDVLVYYKNDHSKKPIRVINLNLCEQVDAGLTFDKKDLENSFIFDIKTIERVFYLVADTEEDMNKWVRSICEICGFNPTDDDSRKPPAHSGGAVVDVPPHPAHATIAPPVIASVPPPYQPVSVCHLEPSSSPEEPQEYVLLVNCESKKPGASSLGHGDQEYMLLEQCESRSASLPVIELSKSMSTETDCNDNIPSHRTTKPSNSKHGSVNGFFPQSAAIYDSPPPRAASMSVDTGLYLLPRSYSQDTVLLPKSSASSSPPMPGAESVGELRACGVPPRRGPVEARLRQVSLSYDIPPTPGSSSTYQVPRTVGPEVAVSGPSDVPPPRPPKPSPVAPPERSPTETYAIPRPVSETDSNYCVPTGGRTHHSNTISVMDASRLRKDFGSQDCYDIPRILSDRSSSFDFNESLNGSFKSNRMIAASSASTEEVDENYVPMSANSPSHHQMGSMAELIHETNYVPMTPSTAEFSSLGKQVPPPAHMGFRTSPKTPPCRPMLISDCQPPPVHRNLKPDRKGQSPKVRVKPIGLERSDSQTVGELPGRRKTRPAPLEIKTLPEWEELPAPVHSPVTRSFVPEEESFYCTVPITPVKREVSGLDTLEESMKLSPQISTDGGSSPMTKTKADKQVEYLDLDLDPGKSTPPRKKKSNGTGSSVSDERVDYVVVDQQRTQALKNTREAWNDERQSTETDTPTKGSK